MGRDRPGLGLLRHFKYQRPEHRDSESRESRLLVLTHPDPAQPVSRGPWPTSTTYTGI